MTRKLNFRFALAGMVLLAGAAVQIVRERRPSMLRPGLRLCAYVASAADGNVTVVDLVRLAATRNISVGPAPSGLRAHPTRKEIWGVSTEGGYVWVIDAPHDQVAARIPVGAAPFALDFSPDGRRAYVAASGANSVAAIDVAERKIVARGRAGRGPWIARVTPDGELVVVANRDDATVSLLDAKTLVPIATVPVLPQPEQIAILPD